MDGLGDEAALLFVRQVHDDSRNGLGEVSGNSRLHSRIVKIS